MTDTITDTEPTTPVDLNAVVEAVVELMRSGVRPDVLEAQRILLHRVATAGDVFPSRVPAPRNVTEVGGYLNLLESLAAHDVRLAAVSAALGLAAPDATGATGPGGSTGFADLPNDRPVGHPATPSVPPVVRVRADLHGSLLSVLAQVHAAGAQLPLRPAASDLPARFPGGVAPTTDQLLSAAGRVVEVFPGTVLVDPAADPVLVAREEAPASAPFVLAVRETDGGTTVPAASWVAKRATSAAVVDDPPATTRLLPVAALFEAAGWYHAQPVELPGSLTARGSLVRFRNVTGLVAGESTLGDELGALHPAAAIARSALAPLAGWVWDGTGFAAT